MSTQGLVTGWGAGCATAAEARGRASSTANFAIFILMPLNRYRFSRLPIGPKVPKFALVIA